jgi:2-hydroxy-3-oxopropionate reductase
MNLAGPFTRDSRVGFIGLGSMGGGMARCLLRDGYRLKVFARRSDTVRGMVEAGAEAARFAAEVGRDCPLVFLSLPDAAAVEDVLFASDGLADALAPGSCVVDTSTIAADSSRDMGERLQQRGVWLLDAPVSGGQQGAQAGTLACMVGGEPEVLAACREAMSTFCKTISHVGALGSGQTVKACNQVAVAGVMLGVAEAIALARSQGVDPVLMREVLLGGAARSFVLEKHAPRIVEGHFTPGFRAHLMRKDLRLALETGRARQAVLPTTSLAEQLLDALCGGGRGDWDWCAVALQVQQLCGMAIPDAPEPS